LIRTILLAWAPAGDDLRLKLNIAAGHKLHFGLVALKNVIISQARLLFGVQA
jgi:hypothetical protein